MAKRSVLAKNASTTDLTHYINPVLVNRRRSSLFCTTVDPALKRMRQREAYKTAMCQAWLEGRSCVYGDQCNFAHGQDELQPLPANRTNPKHKTRVCENYTTTGICPFGNRCFFIHPKTEEELEALMKYNENLSLHGHDNDQLEDDALISHPAMVSRAVGGTVQRRRFGDKLKQFRKMDSCGTFNLPYPHAQNEQHEQQQWHSSTLGGVSVEHYEKFSQLSSSSSSAVGMLTGKSLINMKSNAAKSMMMPLIHSTSVTNLNYTSTDQKIENAERELDKRLAEMRLTMRKMSQQKSFSSNDVCANRATTTQKIKIEKREGKETTEQQHSSGPHTPPMSPGLTAYSFPGFYEHERLGWSSTSLASVWSPPGSATLPAVTASASEQAVPTFCFFEAAANGQIGGGAPPHIERGPVLRAGKRSPDFEGILMGRRSSHIPLLEEDNEMLLLTVMESGMQKARNKSAEYLSGGGGVGDDHQEDSAENNGMSVGGGAASDDCWWRQSVTKRSTSEFDNDETRTPRPQFGRDDDDEHHIDGSGCDAEKQQQKIARGGTVAANWGQIGHGRQCCGSSKLLDNLQTTNSSITSGNATTVAATASKIDRGHIANTMFCNRSIEQTRMSNLDKMQQLWASSSPNLDNKNCEESSSSSTQHQLWTPFGIQNIEIPSQIDLRTENFHNLPLDLSEPRDRIDTLTNANQQEEKEDEAELVNLYSKMRMNEEYSMKNEKCSAAGDGDGGFNEFLNPTWAQMVRRKANLRQKSHSSPAINRNCSAQSAAGNM